MDGGLRFSDMPMTEHTGSLAMSRLHMGGASTGLGGRASRYGWDAGGWDERRWTGDIALTHTTTTS